MNLPYVGAVVQYRGPSSSGVWLAAIVTNVRFDRLQVANTRSGWINGVDLVVFPSNGGVRPVRLVGRLREGAADDEQLDEDVWRWAPESGR